MKKITTIISLLAVICLISGGYAFMSEDNNTNDNLASTIISEKSNSDSSSVLNTASSKSEEVPTANNDAQKENSAKSTQSSHNIASSEGETSNNKEIDLIYSGFNYGDSIFTDRYTQCAPCGKFIPLGPVTIPLPEDALCDGLGECEQGEITNDPIHYYWSYSVEEVLYYTEHGSFEGYTGTLTKDAILAESGLSEIEYVNKLIRDSQVIDEKFNDRYQQCVCGKFIPLRDITTPLPDKALCFGEDCGRVMNGLFSGIHYEDSYSIEEALYLTENNNSFEGFTGVITRNLFYPPQNHCLDHGGCIPIINMDNSTVLPVIKTIDHNEDYFEGGVLIVPKETNITVNGDSSDYENTSAPVIYK